MTTSGLVVKKEMDEHREKWIYFKTFGETKEEIETIKIRVDNVNVWHLIEEDRFYFVTFFGSETKDLQLNQIKPNDEFPSKEEIRNGG